MKAKHYLSQYQRLTTIIKNKQIEKEQWFEAATRITSSYDSVRVQTSGGQGRMAEAAVEYADLGREIDRQIVEAEKAKRNIIHTIEQLQIEEYDVLHKHYVQGLTLMEVADLKNKSYSLITTVHGRGLKKVQAILDEKE